MKKTIGILFIMLLTSFVSSNIYGNNQKKNSNDEKAIIKLENEWLGLLHDEATLDKILASDFVHVVPQGFFLTKEQHIKWAVSHPMSKEFHQKFDTLTVRVYGNSAIANGIVETFDQAGKSVRKSIFTDVFVKRNGTWQAVNAQENAVQ